MVFSVILAVVLLGSILIEVIINGVGALSINFLTQPPGAIGSVGVLAGIYLSEFGGKGIFPSVVRFFNDVLVGLPSIVIGIVAYITLVLTLGSFSGLEHLLCQ